MNEQQVEKLFHLKKHYNMIQQINPKSIEEIADCLALIRPSKRYLIPKYARANHQLRKNMQKELYSKPSSGEIWFKRSHAIAYAHLIVIQLHLITKGKL